MKTLFRLSVLVLALGFGAVFALANSAESARVILVYKKNNDLLVERLSGDLWVLQHNPLCSSMTSEFPVSLIIVNGKIDQLKVNSNEICKVYNAFPYSGEALMAARVQSDNELHPEHTAELVWGGKRYSVDYGKGCLDIREMVGQKIYLSLPSQKLQGGTIELPNNRGQCAIETAKEIGVDNTSPTNIPPKLEGLEYQAQNNQVYFYWKAVDGEKPLYLVSYSRFQLNPSLYPWSLMPNLKVAQTNSYTVRQLANRQQYYFYFASLSKDNVAGEWTEVAATPVSTGGLKNNPDPDPFEVTMTEDKMGFRLTWPAKDTVRKFRLSLFVNGKPEFSNLVSATTLEYVVPKKAEYKGKGFRFTVRSLSKTPYDPSYYDGIYWEYKAKQ
jgi:hypothetical protein